MWSRSSVFGSTSHSRIFKPARATAEPTEKQVYAGMTTSRRPEHPRNAFRSTVNAARPERSRNTWCLSRRRERCSSSRRESPRRREPDERIALMGSGAPAGAVRRQTPIVLRNRYLPLAHGWLEVRWHVWRKGTPPHLPSGAGRRVRRPKRSSRRWCVSGGRFNWLPRTSSGAGLHLPDPFSRNHSRSSVPGGVQ